MKIIKRNTFKEDVESSKKPKPTPARGARVITVTSGKGGVGKTSLTVNLAIALAQLNQRVIIFDADLGMANVDVLLGIAPGLTLHDQLYHGVPVEDIILPGPGGISIIPGGSGFLELANLTREQRTRLLNSIQKLDRMADFIIIDTGAGISKDVLAFCASADEVLLVITPEPTSMTDAYGLIKVLDKFKIHREVFFVINQTRTSADSTDTVYKMKMLAGKYLDIKLNYLGEISYDQVVVNSIKNQKPFLLVSPDSRAAMAVKKIAYSMLNKEWIVEEEGGLQGFISKLSRLFR